MLLPTIHKELLQSDTEHPVFHGSWDWHSSVHGHWACMAAAHHLGDRGLSEWAAARIDSAGMQAELTYLRDNPDFEMPYGRAWLLQLLLVYEQVTGHRSMRKRGDEIADGLITWMDKTKASADTSEYQNDSWTLLQLHQWATEAECPALERRVVGVVRRSAITTPVDLALDHTTPEFFSRWSIQAALLGRVLGEDFLADWLHEQRLDPAEIMPVEATLSVHHLGMNASRSWGAWSAYAATKDPRWARTYLRHLNAALGLHQTWRLDRHAYAHWVPQFVVYGLLLGAVELDDELGMKDELGRCVAALPF